MKAGINVWTWGSSKEQFEQAVKEVSDIGYEAVEHVSTIASVYQDSPEEFDDLMARYGLQFACGYCHLSQDDGQDYARAEQLVRFLERHGASCMNIQAARRPETGVTEKHLADTVTKVTKIAQMAQAAGVAPCLHNHYATITERENEVAYIAERTDPDLLKLTIDTAHVVLGGMDLLAMVKRYAGRVGYVHMKDVVPERDPDQPWWSRFRDLGRGIIDFQPFVAVLERAGFDGVLCVEMDRPPICGYKSAAISHQYMRDQLGL